jgi:protoporphyrinogen oxidase
MWRRINKKSFCIKNFGKAATFNLIEPALGGIYATRLSKLSATLIFRRVFQSKSTKEKKAYA